jgi:acyl-CoA synthetase (AMP-forming)/AMP-acid ligase II
LSIALVAIKMEYLSDGHQNLWQISLIDTVYFHDIIKINSQKETPVETNKSQYYGKPKGAMRTHRHLLSDAVASAIDLKVGYDEKVLITFPMYHVACEGNIVRRSYLPNTIHIRKEGAFNPAEVLEYITKERISRAQFVPTMIHSLIQVRDVGKYDLSSLKLILYAGSSMPVERLKRAITVFPCGFAQLYGQTESGPFTTVLLPEDHILDGIEKRVARLASSGKPALNYEIRIVDENDNDVPPGEVGEIIGRSEAMTIGYWQMLEATAEKLKNGWLHTGDLEDSMKMATSISWRERATWSSQEVSTFILARSRMYSTNILPSRKLPS